MQAEAAHAGARGELDAARKPLAEAERKVQRLETEARTLSKVLAVETKNLWPPVMDNVAVEKGYEKALGAALGDDLDAPIDPSAPMRWMGSPIDGERSGNCRRVSSRWPPRCRRRRNLRAG